MEDVQEEITFEWLKHHFKDLAFNLTDLTSEDPEQILVGSQAYGYLLEMAALLRRYLALGWHFTPLGQILFSHMTKVI